MKQSWWSRYWKDVVKVATLIFAVFYVAAFAGVWGDRNYETNFWPNFFTVTSILIGGALGIGWVIMWTSKRGKK